MTELELYTEKIFEDIKHYTEDGIEFWYARELQVVLQYKEWRNFSKTIDKAKEACETAQQRVLDHFVDVNKMVTLGSGSEREINDIMLSRYACYLIVMNGDPRKEIIALGQTYFAVQTRKQELEENQFRMMTEDERRLQLRNDVRVSNKELATAAHESGVKNFGRFQNYGYRGLYNGEILANETHYQVGRKVRQTIAELGGTMPEQLPTPEKSIREIEKEQKQLQM